MERTIYFKNCLGVFQGGGCRAAAYVGAFKESINRGVSFDEVAGTSAGSIIAAFIGAGAKPDYLEQIINKLDFKSFSTNPEPNAASKGKWFLSFLRIFTDKIDIIKYLGLHSSKQIEKFMEEELSKLLQVKSPVLFKDLKIPTTIIATDLRTQKVKVWSEKETPNDEVAVAVRASCNIPFFFQPLNNRYIDGGALCNLPTFVFNKRNEQTNERILAFSLESSNEHENEISTIVTFISSLADTIINGAQDLQLNNQSGIHLISIPTGDIKATDFDKMTPEKINTLIVNGINATRTFFEKEVLTINEGEKRIDICETYFQTYNTIALTSEWIINEVRIAEVNTDWVYKLFPTILNWRISGAKVSLFLKENTDDEKHGPFRQRLLKSMGVNLKIIKSLPFRGFIFNPKLNENTLAIVRTERTKQDKQYDGVIYSGRFDSKVISILDNCFPELIDKDIDYSPPIIKKGDPEEIINLLKKGVHQYANNKIKIVLEKIEISSLSPLTKFVTGYKYTQVNKLFEIFSNAGIEPFYPSKLVYYDKKEAYITPPVIERYGDKNIVIEGTTRVTFCYKNNIREIYAIVVTGVEAPLPSSQQWCLNDMIISSIDVEGDTRYGGFTYDNFRSIEKAIRNPANCLL
jgi:Predicted esterase of the alpha-beta hydrolase superfamily